MIKINYFKTKYDSKRGFALLFAVITASVLLTIGLSIFNISLKELLLSTAARDSQIAFYAADSARECLLYWDTKKTGFRTCATDECLASDILIEKPIICGTKKIDVMVTPDLRDGTPQYTTTGKFLYLEAQEFLGTNPDSSFSIVKTYNLGEILTEINTFGHNAGEGERRVERGIKQTY